MIIDCYIDNSHLSDAVLESGDWPKSLVSIAEVVQV